MKLYEILVVMIIPAAIAIALSALVVWVLIHFISKFW